MPADPVSKLFARRNVNDIRIVEERKCSRRIAIGAFENFVLNVGSLGNLALLNSNASLYSFVIIFRSVDRILDNVILIDNERKRETVLGLEFFQNLFNSIRFCILLANIVISEFNFAICKIRISHKPHFIRNAERHKALLATGRKVDRLIEQIELNVLFEVCKLCCTGPFRRVRRRRRFRLFSARRGLVIILGIRRLFIILCRARRTLFVLGIRGLVITFLRRGGLVIIL